LEHPGGILEVLECLLEDPDHLFEHRPLILEVPRFIRTFMGLLEHRANLLEVLAYLIRKCGPLFHRLLLLELPQLY